MYHYDLFPCSTFFKSFMHANSINIWGGPNMWLMEFYDLCLRIFSLDFCGAESVYSPWTLVTRGGSETLDKRCETFLLFISTIENPLPHLIFLSGIPYSQMEAWPVSPLKLSR